MKESLFASALALALLSIGPGEARADTPAHHAVFALVVTNNRSADLGRPDLRYADDDGVKYAEVFRMVAPEQNVQLLTELDRDSALLYPELKGKLQPPTKAELSKAASRVARGVSEARAHGDEVDFYFVFAGHGDVDRGKGFLELTDGRFTSDDVEAMLKSIPATRAHVILDSCNSFFVLNARKPGGSRVAIPEAAARSLSERLPNVGVFLSTSAEAEVFEWSELQSGIFSHAVRSGLMGAADANHDGVVSYDELRAFVGVASMKVRNPLYRPNVFARGPGGHGEAPIFPLARATGARIELDAAPRARLTVRDADDLPWIDVHKEEGARIELRIPQRLAAHASVDELEVSDAGQRVLRRHALAEPADGQPLRLAMASEAPSAASARGPDDALRMLFSAPFGPRAMAAYEVSEADEEPVYGVSHEDVERMRLLLAQVAGIERSDRLGGGAAFIGLGALFGGAGGFSYGLRNPQVPRWLSYELWGAGALSLGISGYQFLSRSYGEELYDDFTSNMAQYGANHSAKIVEQTETRLFQLAAKYRTRRRLTTILGAVSLTVSLGGLIPTAIAAEHSSATGSWYVPMEFGVLSTMSSVLLVRSLFPEPVERMADLWKTDPGRWRLPPASASLAVIPAPGGAMLGLRGTF